MSELGSKTDLSGTTAYGAKRSFTRKQHFVTDKKWSQLPTDKKIRQTFSRAGTPSPRTFASTELPGGAVNVYAANNAYARIGRAGLGLAGPGRSYLGSRPANKPSVTTRGAPGVHRFGMVYGSPMITPISAI